MALAATLISGWAAAAVQSFSPPYASIGSIERLDPALDRLIPPDARIEKLADGFHWSEGPVWLRREKALLFSDVPENTIYRWSAEKGITVFLKPSGWTGDPAQTREGSNGLTLDAEDRLVLAQHGDRRVARLAPGSDGFSTLVERYDGKRFNSPNDLCFDRAGRIYFTDPPYGLPKGVEPELGFCGVYRLDTNGTVTLITRELERPNGVALSPDQRTLYVANSHPPRPIIWVIPLSEDGTPGKGRVFFDASSLMKKDRPGIPDGMKIDTEGNLWATGPGGVLVISPEGKHLGTLLTGRSTANCAFGEDGSTLFLTADSMLLRLKTRVQGEPVGKRLK